MMLRLGLVLLLCPFFAHAAGKSCGSYVKNGKTVHIPCSLGNHGGNAGSQCKASISIDGKTVNLQHRCIVKKTGQTGATRIVEPSGDFKSRQSLLKDTINTLAAQYQLPPALVHAVVTVESAYRDDVVSDKGAIGLMQLMPGTASELNVVNPFEAAANLDGGIRYLARQMQAFNHNTELALAAYNAGPESVRRHQNSVPPFAETQKYIARVIAYRDHYQSDWKKHIE
ncbi:MAG: lytic transglycosylase domain-containing protein [Cardiobacteriaceae bacterium]|nr:lytic transglycosylase domain-containing protein [Cardiobacteriaceae bacterium]